ncbi:MAG: hypothetical protein LUD00_00865 [Prevotellaceae bacterium]|nr:hypothetical protein [Prevotellaceae bacterium]
MSTNAKRSHDKGLMPLSSFGRKELDQSGFPYSVAFFRWLCRNEYIMPKGFHHTGAAKTITKFYSPGAIGSFAGQANIPVLYAMYKGKMTLDEAFETIGVRYYKIECAKSVLGIKETGSMVCDALYYEGIYYVTKERKFNTGKTSPRLYHNLAEYKRGDPAWINKYGTILERKILLILSRPRKEITEAECRKYAAALTLKHTSKGENDLSGTSDADSSPASPGRTDGKNAAQGKLQNFEFMTKRQREAWELKNQGLDYKQIAKRMQVCDSVARQHVMNAEKRLEKYAAWQRFEEKNRDKAGTLWRAQSGEKSNDLKGADEYYPSEMPLTKADAAMLLDAMENYIGSMETHTTVYRQWDWVAQMPCRYRYAVGLDEKIQLAVYGEIRCQPGRASCWLEETEENFQQDVVNQNITKAAKKEGTQDLFHIHDQKEAVMNYGESQYAEGRTKATLECIRNLMETMGMTAEQAVQALGIPADEQAGYIDML